MNFVIYAIRRKKSNKIVGQGFMFTYRKREEFINKKRLREISNTVLSANDFDPRYFQINFAHFRGLREVIRSFFHVYWYDQRGGIEK